jgi:hypothetical protein
MHVEYSNVCLNVNWTFKPRWNPQFRYSKGFS